MRHPPRRRARRGRTAPGPGRSASCVPMDGTEGELRIRGTSQQPIVAEVHVLAAGDCELLRVAGRLDAGEVLVGRLAGSVIRSRLVVPQEEISGYLGKSATSRPPT